MDWGHTQQISTGHGLTFKEHTVHKLLNRRHSGSFEGIVGRTQSNSL